MSIFLPDVNVWIGLAVIEHARHSQAIRWFDSTSTDTLAFCRVTQMGFLRLLTNSRVMAGDALTSQSAWRRLDRVYQEITPIFAPEPMLLEDVWRPVSSISRAGPNMWTDAYLAAFAQISGFTLVTFDRGIERYKNTAVLILDPRS